MAGEKADPGKVAQPKGAKERMSTNIKNHHWHRVLPAIAVILLTSAALAAGGHLFNHQEPVEDLEDAVALRIEKCNAALSQKIEKLMESIAAVHDEVRDHSGEKGIHQTPEEKAALRFKTAVEVVDDRVVKLEGKIGDLQVDLRNFLTTERETVVERLLKLEAQQGIIVTKMEELKAELRSLKNP